MYAIHFRRWFNRPDDRQVIAEHLPTLEDAKALRFLSGDLVVYDGTDEIVPLLDWLWGWEKLDPHCYAQQAIRNVL